MDAVSPPSMRRLRLLSRLQNAGDASFEHPARGSQRCAMVEGFSVHANVAVKAEDQAAGEPPAAATDDKPAPMSRRIRWAQLIKRVFKKDLEKCPHCSGRRVLIAFITDDSAIQKILTHVGLAHRGAPRGCRTSAASAR